MAEGFDINDDDLTSAFNDAANMVQASVTGLVQGVVKPSEKQLLDLYGLYKVATTGPCKEAQPGIFNMKARTKWSAWKEKSELSETEAKLKYINQVMSIFDWTPTSEAESSSNGSKGFAPAVSRPHVPDEPENLNDKDTPFGWVKDNDITKINQWMAEGDVDVNQCDEDGLTLLHWAADRGHKEVCEILLKAGANPKLTDEDEQTPLDYAVTCEHEDIINLLKSYVEIMVSSAK